jgi:DNA-binding MarR family transcriptional regulator
MEKKNYKFGIVSKDVVTDPELSLSAKGIYSILSTYLNKNRTCFPSIGTIADIANVSCSTVDRRLKELKDKGYIIRINRKLKLK